MSKMGSKMTEKWPKNHYCEHPSNTRLGWNLNLMTFCLWPWLGLPSHLSSFPLIHPATNDDFINVLTTWKYDFNEHGIILWISSKFDNNSSAWACSSCHIKSTFYTSKTESSNADSFSAATSAESHDQVVTDNNLRTGGDNRQQSTYCGVTRCSFLSFYSP